MPSPIAATLHATLTSPPAPSWPISAMSSWSAEHGTGKSHLAIAIARPLIRNGARGRFFNVVDLVNRLERRAVAQSARLAGQHRHVVPGIVDDLVATEPAGMLAHDYAVLADNDPVSTGQPTALDSTEYLLLWKRTVHVLDTDAGMQWKPSKRPA